MGECLKQETVCRDLKPVCPRDVPGHSVAGEEGVRRAVGRRAEQSLGANCEFRFCSK